METVPAPSPWKTLRRFGARIAPALVIALLIWGLWYGWVARAVKKRAEAYRARGAFGSMEDLRAGSAGGEDARDFARRISLPAGIEVIELHRRVDRDLWTPWNLAEAEKLIAARAGAMSEIRRSRPVLALKWRYWMDHQELADLGWAADFIWLTARYYHRVGPPDDTRELEAILDLLCLARLAGSGQTSPHYSSQVSIEERSLEAAAAFSETFTVGEPPRLTRAQVKQLIDYYGDNRSFHAGLVTAFEGDRVRILAEAERVDASWIIMPTIRMGALRVAEEYDRAIESLGPGIPSFRSVGDPFTFRGSADSNLKQLHQLITPDGSNWLIGRHMVVMEQRKSVAEALASRLYELEKGAPPPSAQSLIPEYLRE